MVDNGVFRRRHLPHWDVPGRPVFITGCLHGSISAAGLARIRGYRKYLDSLPRPNDVTVDDWDHRQTKRLFAFIDKLLDHECPVRFLADDRQAEIVQNAFLHFADVRYRLLAFVVMPSHHHWLFVPLEKWTTDDARKLTKSRVRRTSREVISHTIQSFTANECNRIRGATGPYWQRETFDHWARDEAESLRIIDYIEQNPVAAGLVACASDWRWSSAHLRERTGAKRGESIRAVP